MNKSGARLKAVFITGSILLVVIVSAFGKSESTEPVLNKRVPHPPTSQPPDIRQHMAVRKPKPTHIPPQSKTSPLPSAVATPVDLSGYFAFMAGAMLLFRRVEN